MEAQIENAVGILGNPYSDQSLKQQAHDYLHQLRADPSAWQTCINLFVRSAGSDDVLRLFCLEAVNYAVHTQSLDQASLTYLKDLLLDYVRQVYGPEPQRAPDPPSLQNKVAQTLTYLFVFLYQNGWQSFLDDFLDISGLPSNKDNVNGVIFYLRILSSIHDEIADMLLARQNGEAKRNTELKDQLRAQDVYKVADSWKQLLVKYNNNDAVVELVLKVIAKWVSWMDISLVVSQDMLSLLIPLVGRPSQGSGEDKVRDSAIETLTQIVGKKMRPQDKVEMISFLNLREIVSQLLASPALGEYKGTSHYDTDLGEAVASLVNVVIADIVRALEDSSITSDTRNAANQHLNAFLPFLLRFFTDDYDEICSSVIPALTDLLTFLRKLGQLPQEYSQMLSPILDAIIRKMRYDEDANWGNEDEQTDEAEFQDLRRKLQNLQKTIAAIDQSLYMETLSNLMSTTFQTLEQQGSQMDWRDLDLALYEMYVFGELALPNHGLHTKNQPSGEASERLVVMIRKMVESGVANLEHPAILLQYMEICVRYCVVFENHQDYIPVVLESFVRLVHHDHVRIKTRSWYLFHRFIKHLRAQVGTVAETVIQSIGDLLPIKAEVPGEDADDDMSSDESDHSADALFTSQLYLFEAIGCMASTSGTPAEKQAMYARSVIDPLFSDMEAHLPRAKAGDAQATLQIHHIIMALGVLAHGFSDWTPGSTASQQHAPPDEAVSAEFSRAAEAILYALKELSSSSDIRLACRSAFSRLLGVLGSAVLPQLPQWIEGLLSQNSSKDEIAMFLRLLDQIVFGFKSEIFDVLNMLLTPLLERIFTGLSEPPVGTDDEVQQGELRREYLSFIQIILNNNLDGVLISEANQGSFEKVVATIVDIARDLEAHLGPSRLAFTVMTRISAIWGGPDVATIAQNPTPPTGPATPAIPGFDHFMISRFHAICWEVLRNPNLKTRDAQSKQLVVEIAGLEQIIYTKTGEVFIQQLQNELFPSIGVNGDDFLRALTTNTDKKGFSNYLLELLKSWQQ